jgi:hypothetical protein
MGGVAGGPGEDTIVNLCDEDGHVLRSIVAKGGKPGARQYVPPSSRLPTDDDLQAGLKVTGMLAAEYIRIKGGLITIIDGGWDFWTANSNPFRVELPLLVEVETGTIEPGTILELKLVVRNPDGFQLHEQGQTVGVGEWLARRSRFGTVLNFSGSQAGLWNVQILAGRHVIGTFPFEIRLPTPDK